MTVVTLAEGCGDTGAARWRTIQTAMRAAYGEDVYTSWLEGIKFEGLDDGKVMLSVATRFMRHWVLTNYVSDILQRWRTVEPTVTDVVLIVRGALRPAKPTEAAAPVTAGTPSASAQRRPAEIQQPANSFQGLDGSPLDPRNTFENIVEGTGNAFAIAAAKRAVKATPGERSTYNVLFLNGAVGLGKTMTLQAIAAAARDDGVARRVLYLTAEHFMYRFVSAIRTKSTIPFKDLVQNIDILLIDDLQFLNGQKVHEEFAHTVTALVDSNRQVVVAADRAPADLDGLEPRVRSRLGGGLLAELDAPNYTMRYAIIEQRVAMQKETFPGLIFPQEVMDFVARSVTTNGRDLDGAVNRLVAHNQLTGTGIDLKMAETVLRDLTRAREAKRPKIEDIQRVTCQHFNIQKQDLVSTRRTRVIVRPRQIAMYLSKQLTPRSLPEIGKRFGDRDHTTVLHAVRKIEELMAEDKQIAEDIETLKRLLDQ